MTTPTDPGEATPRDAGSEIAEFVQPGEPPRDAIAEEDNDIPLWFNVGFYGMLVVGIVYILYYTLSGWSQTGQYEEQVARFDEEYAAFQVAAAEINPLRGRPEALTEGKRVYAQICVACHKPDGTGLIGPSLVDPYWKYGDSDSELFITIAEGRPAGMPPWKTALSDDEIWAVLAYLETLPRQSEPGLGAPAAAGADGAAAADGS